MPAGRASSRKPLKTSTANEIARTTSTTPITTPAETITTPLRSPSDTDPLSDDACGPAMRQPMCQRVRSLGGALDPAHLSVLETCSGGLDDPVDCQTSVSGSHDRPEVARDDPVDARPPGLGPRSILRETDPQSARPDRDVEGRRELDRLTVDPGPNGPLLRAHADPFAGPTLIGACALDRTNGGCGNECSELARLLVR